MAWLVVVGIGDDLPHGFWENLILGELAVIVFGGFLFLVIAGILELIDRQKRLRRIEQHVGRDFDKRGDPIKRSPDDEALL